MKMYMLGSSNLFGKRKQFNLLNELMLIYNDFIPNPLCFSSHIHVITVHVAFQCRTL